MSTVLIIVIACAAGGGVLLLVLGGVLFWFWRRAKQAEARAVVADLMAKNAAASGASKMRPTPPTLPLQAGRACPRPPVNPPRGRQGNNSPPHQLHDGSTYYGVAEVTPQPAVRIVSC